MQGFWQLFSILISLLGFAITGALLLVRGDSLALAAVKAVAAFVALYIVQRMLGGILIAVAGSGLRIPSKAASSETQKDQAEEGSG